MMTEAFTEADLLAQNLYLQEVHIRSVHRQKIENLRQAFVFFPMAPDTVDDRPIAELQRDGVAFGINPSDTDLALVIAHPDLGASAVLVNVFTEKDAARFAEMNKKESEIVEIMSALEDPLKRYCNIITWQTLEDSIVSAKNKALERFRKVFKFMPPKTTFILAGLPFLDKSTANLLAYQIAPFIGYNTENLIGTNFDIMIGYPRHREFGGIGKWDKAQSKFEAIQFRLHSKTQKV